MNRVWLVAFLLLASCASFQQGRVLRLAHYPKDLPMKIGSFVVEGSGYNPVFDRGLRQMIEFSLREKGLPLLPNDAPEPESFLEIEVVCLVTQPELFGDAPSIVNLGLTSRYREKQRPPVVSWQGNWVFRSKPLQVDEKFLLALRHVAFCVWADGRPLPAPRAPKQVAPRAPAPMAPTPVTPKLPAPLKKAVPIPFQNSVYEPV